MKNSNVKKNILRTLLTLTLTLVISTVALTSCAPSVNSGGAIDGPPRYFAFFAEQPIAFNEVGTPTSVTIGIEAYRPYDYIQLTYEPTIGITLDGEEPNTITYNQKTSIQLGFTATPSFDGISLVYQETVFELIDINAVAYKDGEVIYQAEAGITVLASPHGIFATYLSYSGCYRLYLDLLSENELITRDEALDASNSIVEGRPIINEPKNSVEENPENQEAVEQNNFIEPQNENEINNIAESSISSTYAAPTNPVIDRPTVIVDYDVDALNGGNQLKISGIVNWTDILQNESPARKLNVEIKSAIT